MVTRDCPELRDVSSLTYKFKYHATSVSQMPRITGSQGLAPSIPISRPAHRGMIPTWSTKNARKYTKYHTQRPPSSPARPGRELLDHDKTTVHFVIDTVRCRVMGNLPRRKSIHELSLGRTLPVQRRPAPVGVEKQEQYHHQAENL